MLLGVVFVFTLYKAPGPLDENRVIIIDQGASFSQIANRFQREDIINHAILFKSFAYLLGKTRAVQFGEFEFQARWSYAEVLHHLTSGDPVMHQLTIPEGLSVYEIVALMSNEEMLKGEASQMPAEGSLLPETYHYIYGQTKDDLIDWMQKDLKDLLVKEWPNRAENLPVKTPEEAVILASIVEKETAIADERNRIAGVFTNRLRIKMPLQSDPTVIYAITKGEKPLSRKLYYKDLKFDSPFNTYKYRGLPPKPICNPGKKAILAVLHPEKNPYLYFVVDGKGGHDFAKSLKEHQNNVKRYRVRQQKERVQR